MQYHDGMNHLRAFIRFLFTLITICLIVTFVIRIFAPGNADTAVIFQTLQHVQPWLDIITNALTYPVQAVLDKLFPLLPENWLTALQGWFPFLPAAAFFEGVANLILKLPKLAASPVGEQLKAVNYPALFPGVMDWRLLLSVLFWGMVESLLLKAIIYVEAFLYRQFIRHRDADFIAEVKKKPF